MRVAVEVAGYRYGGTQFGGIGRVLAPAVTTELFSFPDAVRPARERDWGLEVRTAAAAVATTSTGDLIDPRGNSTSWKVQSAETLSESIADFFAMVDGPVQQWIDSVTPVEELLEWLLWGGASLASA